MSSHRKRGRHYQPEAVGLDLVNPEFLKTVFFSALRFLVTVLSDLSGCSCVLKSLFSKLWSGPSYLRSLIRSFFIPTPLSLSMAYRATRSVAIIGVGSKRRTVPLGLAKNGAVRVTALRTPL
jgi:hypothetical protein